MKVKIEFEGQAQAYGEASSIIMLNLTQPLILTQPLALTLALGAGSRRCHDRQCLAPDGAQGTKS